MSQWLSDTDRERIEQFARLPAYERRPDMLLPAEGDDEP